MTTICASDLRAGEEVIITDVAGTFPLLVCGVDQLVDVDDVVQIHYLIVQGGRCGSVTLNASKGIVRLKRRDHWRRWKTEQLSSTLDGVDDSTELWDAMADELAEREHEHEVRVLNGGILP